jgi:serine phosphatase RsbU (regulator of sigma subunit)
VSVIVLVAGLVVTAALALGAREVHEGNEDRLLDQRAHETATIARAAIQNVQVPLLAAVGLAEATNGDADAFVRQMGPLIESRRAVSASLWRVDADPAAPRATRGAAPELASEPAARIAAVLAEAERSRGLTIVDLLDGPERRIGYALVAPAASARYMVYTEAALPRDRKARIASNTGFDDLAYALYLGRTEDPQRLLASSSGGAVPPDVRRAAESLPFGSSHILIVISPTQDLGGALLARLPGLLAVGGVVLTLALTLLVERVGRQRARAEHLAFELEIAASENERLYTEQREIASTLQRGLLPDRLPTISGVETAARYEAGVEGAEIGGDWYDVIPLGPDRLLFSVGDVCGRGLGPATTMAALRYSIRAHALEGLGPAAILDRLAPHLEPGRDDRFATAVCAVLDVSRRELTVSRAGHLDLLLVTGARGDTARADYIEAPVGVPIGVQPDVPYREVIVSLPPSGTVLAFTDGLVERRGENLEIGLDRLARSAVAHAASPTDLVDGTVADLAHGPGSDDLAVLAVRWEGAPTARRPPRTQRDPARA